LSVTDKSDEPHIFATRRGGAGVDVVIKNLRARRARSAADAGADVLASGRVSS